MRNKDLQKNDISKTGTNKPKSEIKRDRDKVEDWRWTNINFNRIQLTKMCFRDAFKEN